MGTRREYPGHTVIPPNDGAGDQSDVYEPASAPHDAATSTFVDVAVGATVPALAADLPARTTYTKAPAYIAPLYNWTGFYIGGHIGGAFNGDSNFAGLSTGNNSNGRFLGGLQVGADYQFAPNWVVGLEGQYSWLASNNNGVIFPGEIGNRDPDAFANPNDLDLTRDARRHVAFGFGVHQCLGQPLARAELQIVYSTLYRRIPTLALAADPDTLDYKDDAAVYGVRALPVTW